MRRPAILLLLALCPLGLPGCAASILATAYETTIDFEGQTLGAAATGWDGAKHVNVLFGTIEVSDPVPLNAICPNGVSYVEQRMTPGDSFLQSVTLGIYTPQSVTVICNEDTSAF
ncbi:MAG: hypothetical protein JXR96_10920 [Deltaproteobacteria bacterium]|nr:hypothetical protein [Deltaproteobacteria bacterium]